MVAWQLCGTFEDLLEGRGRPHLRDLLGELVDDVLDRLRQVAALLAEANEEVVQLLAAKSRKKKNKTVEEYEY